MPRATVRDQAQMLRGTIIVDRVAFNYTRTRLWWSPDAVVSIAPAPPPPSYLVGGTDEPEFAEENYHWPPFDRWAWQRYLDPVAGQAHLIGFWRRGLSLAEVTGQYPGCQVVRTFSGGRQLARICSTESDNQDQANQAESNK